VQKPQEKQKQGQSGFGHVHLAGELADFLDERLADPPRSIEPSPVIGIFGEWGSGKSSLLHEIHVLFQTRVDAFNPREAGNRLVLPVRFNPWRFEKEDHLFVPLLKTLQISLQKFAQQNSIPEEEFVGSIVEKAKQAAKTSAIAALSFASMFKLRLGVPGMADVSVDPNAAIEQAKALLDENRKDDKDLKAIDELSSHYFEFVEELKQITEKREQEAQLNLLFLIDDLDRCLPEKAVEMLEAIKLFLDVPGCGFVVAVDDAVVERGIQHRYRDYRNHNGAESAATPISGGEYLEKIIHLPVRLPRPTNLEVEQFLKSFDLFRDRTPRRETEPGAHEISRKGEKPEQREGVKRRPVTGKSCCRSSATVSRRCRES
jgi:predicted KAP-like P-loop ATPase